MKTKKRFLSILLSLALVLGLMPGMSLTAYADATISNLWIGNSSEVTATGVISGTGGTGTATVSQEGDYIVLTLDNFSYSGVGYNDNDYVNTVSPIYYSGTSPLIVRLIGTNNITQTGVNSGNSFGFYVFRAVDVRLEGTGTLTVSSGNAGSNTSGIYLGGPLTLSGCTVNATGGSSNYGYATNVGISAGGNVTIDNATVTATGGTVVGSNPTSSGLQAFSYSSGPCNVVLKSGNLTITGTGDDSALYYGNSDYRTKLLLADGSTLETLRAGANSGSAVETTIDNITNQKYIYCKASAPAHTHSFTYSASGATITASCNGAGTCDITTGLTLTISAPTGDLTADGTKTFPAALSTGYNTTAFPEGSISSISYTKDGMDFTGTPKDAGAYVASITVGTGDGAATASVSYTVVGNHTITFNANGGTGTMEPQTISGDGAELNPNAFTRSGQIFVEWNTKADGTGENYYDGGWIGGLTSDITLYAQWIEPNVKVGAVFKAGDTMNFAAKTMYVKPSDKIWDTHGSYTIKVNEIHDDSASMDVLYYDGMSNPTVGFTPAVTGANCIKVVSGSGTESDPYILELGVAKDAATVTKAPTAKTLTYTGSAQELVTAGTADGGTMQYALGADATTAPTTGWGESIPTGTDAGTYYVWYKAVGNDKHTDSDPEVVSVIIAEPDTYTVTVTNDGHGTGSATPASGVEGTEVTLTSAPADGYMFKEWQVVSGGVTVAENKFKIGTANVEIKAVFEEIPADVYTVTVTNDGHGTGSATPASGVEGTEVTLAAAAAEGYQFKEWQVVSGGVTVSENKFKIGTANVEVKAIFEEIPAGVYTVTVTNDGHGTGTATPASGVSGTEVVLAATAAKGYKFKEWQVVSGGVTIAENKFAIGTANVEIKAVFEEIPATVYTFTEGTGAEWTKGTQTGQNFTITGTPDTGIFDKFTGLASDGSAVSPKNYTATSGSVKLTLKAEWLETLAAGKHTLTANFTDGKAEASFTVKDAPPAPTPTPKPKKVPRTGDGAPLGLWIGLIAVGLIGLGTFIALRRRTQKK